MNNQIRAADIVTYFTSLTGILLSGINSFFDYAQTNSAGLLTLIAIATFLFSQFWSLRDDRRKEREAEREEREHRERVKRLYADALLQDAEKLNQMKAAFEKESG